MTDSLIERLAVETPETDGLVTLLQDAVAGGASVGFMGDLTPEEAAAYWHGVIANAAAESRIIWIARDPSDRSVIGSVQLVFEFRPNGRHRAEVQKLMVLRAWRRRGIAAALVRKLEHEARERGITLLYLDTSDGGGGARGFYEALAYQHVGGIPGYALDPDGTPARNAIYYKSLLADGEPLATPSAMEEAMRDINIRQIAAADAKAYFELRVQSEQEFPQFVGFNAERELAAAETGIAGMLEAYESEGTIVWGAFANGRLIGVVALSRRLSPKYRHKAFLWGMYVAPDFRGAGAARALMNAVIAWVTRQPELTAISLQVTIGNSRAQQFYTRFGFSAFGTEERALLAGGRFQGVHYLELAIRRF